MPKKKYSLFSAEFNVREIVKQLLLLEDHLATKSKVCGDCITKHLLTIEALGEEAVQLQPDDYWGRQGKRIAKQARLWIVNWNDGKKKVETLAKEFRAFRKRLMKDVSDPRIKLSKVELPE